MAVIDHGKWDYYVPAVQKEGLPPQVLYAKRITDDVDWYDYIGVKPFGEGSVVMAAYTANDGAEVIQAATFDYTMIFPPKFRVIEETEYSGSDPIADLSHRVYDPATRTIGDKYIPPEPPASWHEQKIYEALTKISKRLDKLEKRR